MFNLLINSLFNFCFMFIELFCLLLFYFLLTLQRFNLHFLFMSKLAFLSFSNEIYIIFWQLNSFFLSLHDVLLRFYLKLKISFNHLSVFFFYFFKLLLLLLECFLIFLFFWIVFVFFYYILSFLHYYMQIMFSSLFIFFISQFKNIIRYFSPYFFHL